MNKTRYALAFIGCYMLTAFVAVFRWLLLLNVQYTYMDNEFPYWIQQKDYVRTAGSKSEILFLGDSRMKSCIIPDQLCDNAYNLAVGGGTAMEMYYSLAEYIRHHPKPEKVFAGFGSFHYAREDCYKSRTLYFHFLPLHQELESLLAAYRTRMVPLKKMQEELLDLLKYELLFPEKYSAACINSKFKRSEFNKKKYAENQAARGHMLFGKEDGSAGLNAEAHSRHFAPHPRGEYYLRRLVSLCKKNDIPLYLIQLPMNEPSWDAVAKNEYYKEFQAYVEAFAQEHDITAETEIPRYSPALFGDPSHVNAKGASEYTRQIKERYGL